MLIGFKPIINALPEQPHIFIENDPVEGFHNSKILCVHINESLKWEKNIDEISKNISCVMSAVRRLKDFADRKTSVSVYNALAQPHFDYCCEVWDSLGDGLARRLQML